MSKKNPFIALGGAHLAWKVADNGTKQYKAMEDLSDKISEQNKVLENQAALNAESIDIQASRAALDRERNQIELSKLDALHERNELTRITNQIHAQDLRLKLIQDERKELRISLETSEKGIKSRQRDCVFNIKKDIEKINSSWETKVEKYIQLANHLASIHDFGISTDLTDSFEDKEMINSTIDELSSILKKVIDQLTEEEVEDILTIRKILQVNEDRLIIDSKFELKEINKEIKKTTKEQEIIHQEESSLKKTLADLLDKQTKHNLSEPQ